jgi:hypothetical protein
MDAPGAAKMPCFAPAILLLARGNLLLKSLVLAAFCGVAPALAAQQPPRAAGVMRTADVDLGYGVYGEQRGNALPVIAVNGGPGLPHDNSS